jgi:hypothetical protein
VRKACARAVAHFEIPVCWLSYLTINPENPVLAGVALQRMQSWARAHARVMPRLLSGMSAEISWCTMGQHGGQFFTMRPPPGTAMAASRRAMSASLFFSAASRAAKLWPPCTALGWMRGRHSQSERRLEDRETIQPAEKTATGQHAGQGGGSSGGEGAHRSSSAPAAIRGLLGRHRGCIRLDYVNNIKLLCVCHCVRFGASARRGLAEPGCARAYTAPRTPSARSQWVLL